MFDTRFISNVGTGRRGRLGSGGRHLAADVEQGAPGAGGAPRSRDSGDQPADDFGGNASAIDQDSLDHLACRGVA